MKDVLNIRSVSIVQPSSQRQAVKHTEYCRLMAAAGDVEGVTVFELPQDLFVGTTNCSS